MSDPLQFIEWGMILFLITFCFEREDVTKYIRNLVQINN